MLQTLHLPENQDPGSKWFSSPITFYNGTIAELYALLPEFERRPLALTQPGNQKTRLNERLDTIVRKPIGDDLDYVPIGVVSRDYSLLPHKAVMETAVGAFEEIRMPLGKMETELRLTEYGERMELSFRLPEEKNFIPEDRQPLALRLRCFNSVDGSSRFRAVMEWFRLVCSNGLSIGVTRFDLRRRHVGDVRLHDISQVLELGLQQIQEEKKNFQKWWKTEIKAVKLAGWIEKDVQKALGFKAAARVRHIAQTGFDADVAGPYKDHTPLTIPVRPTTPVPGAPPISENLYQVSQILAWLAKERRDIQEQIEWQEKIPGLLKALAG